MTRARLGARPSARPVQQLLDQLQQGALQFVRRTDRDALLVERRGCVADTDRQQPDVAGLLDLAGDGAQVTAEIVVAVLEQRGVVDRDAVGQHDQDLSLLLAAAQPRRSPCQRFAVDILLDQPWSQHHGAILRAQRLAAAAVDDVQQVVQPSRISGPAIAEPLLPTQAAFPACGREPEHFMRCTEGVQQVGGGQRGLGRRQHRLSAHRTGMVDQQGDNGVVGIGSDRLAQCSLCGELPIKRDQRCRVGRRKALGPALLGL